MSSSAAASSPPQKLDIEALLSRNYRPARVSQIQRKETLSTDSSQSSMNERRQLSVPSEHRQSSQRFTTDLKTSRIVHGLVAETPNFKQNSAEIAPILKPFIRSTPKKSSVYVNDIPPQFHEIETTDWEKDIRWGDEDETEEKTSAEDGGTILTPWELSQRPRNHYLDNLVLDDSNIGWTEEHKKRIRKDIPLILELGVAGRSVANQVVQNSLQAQRPIPAIMTDEYQARRQKWDGNKHVTSTAMPKSKSLHQDKAQMEAFIKERQKLRAQMAKDKTNRVTQAMGTLALGVSGKGRAITSSLMGPGGTERSGRPTREFGGGFEAGHIEQLEMITSHSLVRDLNKIMLRQYHRPKLPLSIVRKDLSWQFQIRYSPPKKKESGPSAAFMGSHAGAASHAKVRSEADLSPTEGKLVLVEYCEERPIVQLTKGMASKIINYYRGDKAHCPVSAGGGDRPARRKRETDSQSTSSSNKQDRLPLLKRSGKDSIMDWVGELPKRTPKEQREQEAIDVLPEGVTETLHPKVHGPFIGEIEEGHTVTGLITNMFVAPMFRHEPEQTDFLMIVTPPTGAARAGQRDHMGIVLRDLPASVFTAGQVEPRIRVNPPNSQGERNFVQPFVSFQIARALARSQQRDGYGLRFEEIHNTVCPNLELAHNALRNRLKQVAVSDKNSNVWTTKQIGQDDYRGIDALGKEIRPEDVAAFEIASAASRRLIDLGILQLFSGANSAVSVGVAMLYLRAQLNAIKDLSRTLAKRLEASKGKVKSTNPYMLSLYDAAATELERAYKMAQQKIDVAKFVYEQLQLAPWHLTGDFIDVHKKGESTGMMKLTGLGDPSGNGEGFSFLREVDSKPSKSLGIAPLSSAQMKKITGTDDDLRKLTMKKMADVLRSFGMPEKEIAALKRWDRVHVIRELSTKAASDGIADGLERFARGEKMKLSEQKQMYRDRIRVIWRRQLAVLSMADDKGDADNAASGGQASRKKDGDRAKEISDSESEEDDDFFATELENEMMDTTETNQLVADRTATVEGEASRGQLRAAIQDKELTKDARELAALKRQREEERAAQGGLETSMHGMDSSNRPAANRKVIRKKIVSTAPDGKQVTTFKYILQPAEVGKIQARLDAVEEEGPTQKPRPLKLEPNPEERPPGQAMWEDDDDIDYATGRAGSKRRGARARRGGRVTPKGGLQFGKLKTKISAEERMRKRRREEDEMDTYIPTAKRKGTSNRRERGSIRDRRPHVIFADKLEAIRSSIENRPNATPFLKPVNSKTLPVYYEKISSPMDLSTIRDKIKRYEYRTADAMLKDFELMKNNAIKFNSAQHAVAKAAVEIYDFAVDQIASSRGELSALEVSVGEQLNETKPKKKKKSTKRSKSTPGSAANVDGMAVNLGNLSSKFDDSDSGDEVSFTWD